MGASRAHISGSRLASFASMLGMPSRQVARKAPKKIIVVPQRIVNVVA